MHRFHTLLCFYVLVQRTIFTHILQGYFTSTGTIIWLPQYQWNNPEESGFINHMTQIRTMTEMQQNKTNTMAADALTPYATRSSAAMALTVKDKQVLVFHGEEFQCPVPSQHWVMQTISWFFPPQLDWFFIWGFQRSMAYQAGLLN